jgi:hypothetical protein
VGYEDEVKLFRWKLVKLYPQGHNVAPKGTWSRIVPFLANNSKRGKSVMLLDMG